MTNIDTLYQSECLRFYVLQQKYAAAYKSPVTLHVLGSLDYLCKTIVVPDIRIKMTLLRAAGMNTTRKKANK